MIDFRFTLAPAVAQTESLTDQPGVHGRPCVKPESARYQRLRSSRANNEEIERVGISLPSGPGWLQRDVMVIVVFSVTLIIRIAILSSSLRAPVRIASHLPMTPS
jgi:hypothetical protein